MSVICWMNYADRNDGVLSSNTFTNNLVGTSVIVCLKKCKGRKL